MVRDVTDDAMLKYKALIVGLAGGLLGVLLGLLVIRFYQTDQMVRTLWQIRVAEEQQRLRPSAGS